LKVNGPVASIFRLEEKSQKETRMKQVVSSCYRKWHNHEIDDVYLSPNMSRPIKSNKMRWAGHEENMGEKHT
jgi:hypothetical protein